MTLVRVWLCPSSMSVRRTQTTISVVLFLYFNLNQKVIELNNFGHIYVTTQIFFGIFYIYRNLHIEPFNFATKRVCFDFHSTNVGSSLIETGRSEGSLLLPYFYRFRCHYPLITYLNKYNHTNLYNIFVQIKQNIRQLQLFADCY